MRLGFKASLNNILNFTFSSFFEIFLLTAFFYVGFLILVQYQFGSFSNFKHYYSGSKIVVDQPELNIFYNNIEKSVRLTFVCRNFDDIPIKIIGSSSSCSCTLTENLPTHIQVNENIKIHARVNIDSDKAGEVISGSIRIFLSGKEDSELLLKYNLLPAESENMSLKLKNKSNYPEALVFAKLAKGQDFYNCR